MDKELLLKDLCARLPYGVIVQDRNCIHPLTPGNTEFVDLFNDKCNIKPFLRPLSSMTIEECVEFGDIDAIFDSISDIIPNIPYYFDVAKPEQIDWLNAHHFDYRGLIEKGLAIEAPKDMYS
jgi:hypothetical protein